MPPVRQNPDAAALARRCRAGLGLIALGLSQASGAGFRLAWLYIRRALGVLLALILLFEQWGWKPLAAALAAIARFGPIAAFERLIGRLPPYGALVVFALPVALLIPLKLFALFLIAEGHTASAVMVFVAAKIVGTAIVARLYHLTSPQLLRIGWVRNGHDILAPRLHTLHEEIRASWAWRYGRVVKAQTRRAIRPLLRLLKSRLLALLPGGRGAP